MNIGINHSWLAVAIMTGSVLMSGCVIDASPPFTYSAPYGAYFVKPDLDKAQRVQDMIACGSSTGLQLYFTPEQEKAASTGPIKFTDGKTISFGDSGHYNMLNKLDACMKSKGYYKLPLGMCDGYKKEVTIPCAYP